MGKIPHKDFQFRQQLDGSEPLFTQHEDYVPQEQQFTLEQVAAFILAQVKGEAGTGQNGLSGTGEIELGGPLLKHTSIDARDFEFLCKKGLLHLGFLQTDAEGKLSVHLLGKNTNGNWGQIGVTETGQIRLIAKNKEETSSSQLIQTPTIATLQRKNAESETKVSQQGSVLTLQSQLSSGIASFIRVDVATGIHIHDPKTLKIETTEKGQIQIITPEVIAKSIPLGSHLSLADTKGRVAFTAPNKTAIRRVETDDEIQAGDVTLILDATQQSFDLLFPDASQNEGIYFRLVARFANINSVTIRAKSGKFVQGSNETETLQIQNAPDTRTFQSDGQDWILIHRY